MGALGGIGLLGAGWGSTGLSAICGQWGLLVTSVDGLDRARLDSGIVQGPWAAHVPVPGL